MSSRRIILTAHPVNAAVTVPGSKSLTNRALLIAALADGESILTGPLDSEDTQVMAESLNRLGTAVRWEENRLHITGHGGFPEKKAQLYVANSGTTARFLTAALAFARGEYRIDGKERMRHRPIGDLLAALRRLGGKIQSESGNEAFPLVIEPFYTAADSADAVCETEIAGDISSQFLSALLMAAPMLGRDIRISIRGKLVSRPYIEMTLAVMKSFGLAVETADDFSSFRIPASAYYTPQTYAIEPDASAASYFLALPAVVGGKITVRGLSRTSLQGDIRFADCLAAMGCKVDYQADQVTVSRSIGSDGKPVPLTGIDVDMNTISDTAQTLGVAALFAETPTRIRNIAHVRGKETDRISALVTQLRRLGPKIDEFEDGLTIYPDKNALHAARIATYDDHRMAMSFTLAGLAVPGVEIENPECVVKTYPGFYADLDRAFGKTMSELQSE